ncbi:hypothetical protein SSABA_v1c05970 [Spiroplasma sabaudiense Ar-1343]|uniref:Uncharacterized protein n=1 Tax=Spiroplasma sabaudiense Ar-1343 TaxID=1276257 RepID=W6AAG6_9MOLU|nr:hypothetical protein [Spiroplasma sabaudiense]AHI54001.1 hypothetical protein SSABA_v1c05970 [Spiroplasma sabaudiense Ar-1343]
MPISKFILFFAIFSFNFVNCVFVTFLVFGIGQTFFPEQRQYLSQINWPMLISGLFLIWLLSILFSYVIFIAFQNQQVMLAVATMLYFLITYLLGLGFPYHLIVQYQWLKILLYFIPHRYMINVLQAAWVNAPSMKYDFYNNGTLTWSVDFGFGGHLWIPYLVTIILIIVFVAIIFIYLMWVHRFREKDNVGFRAFRAQSLKHIEDLKNINDLKDLEAIRKSREWEIRFYKIKLRAENWKSKINVDNKSKNSDNKTN